MIALHDLLQATGGRLHGPTRDRSFTDFCFDSRLAEPGQLFVAVITDTGDGHDYIPEAARAGATGVLCERLPVAGLSDVAVVQVENTQAALLDYARFVLRQRALPVVAITGSVGKTSTKEAIAAVLGRAQAVFCNPGNYNGRYGLPLALGRLAPEHTIAVLELAADSLDEIRLLAEITRPRIGVVTAVGPSHLQVFGSLEQIAAEKGRLVEALPPDGLAVLNDDDPRVRAMAARTPARVRTIGLSPRADLWAEDVVVDLEGTALVAHYGDAQARLRLPLLGAHHAYTALAAAAVGLELGLTWDEIAAGLAEVAPLPGRTRLLEGLHGARLLDDSYNASPASAAAALDTLARLPAQRRIVVLGDMAELGAEAERTHHELGQRIAAGADLLVALGDLARLAAEGALAAGMPAERVHVSYAPEEAARLLADALRPGDLVLLKGSAAARLERITASLLAEPAQAARLLPRQGRGWEQVRLQHPGRPTWVEVDLGAIAGNLRRLAEIVGPRVSLMAVIKANAYGHGAARVARMALNNGVAWLGVACLGEALALREAGVTAPILNLGYTPPWQARSAVLHGVTCTVFSLEVARALARAAADLGRGAQVHLKIDTGMGRLGLLPDEAPEVARQIAALPGLELDGVLTHLSAADDPDLSYSEWQLDRFDAVLAALRAEGLAPRWVHAANSAALLRLPRSRYNLVRPGIALFGLSPSASVPLPAGLRAALQWKCQVAQVKELPAGSYVGYGRAFAAQRPTRIAVIPVGYADGFRRAPNHWGQVLVRGQRAPIVGRVCMDQTMLDVTDIPGVRAGDEVVLIGEQGRERLTVDEVAARLGTINYEVVSGIQTRVPRMA
ncbi:MAG: alanine racemase [Chloroflexota bacterium]